ncbi:MAG: fluoroacetyl-CoA thioesterase [Betaproteobacteria bacterium]|jgi:fluoroacetyl-CoA thioesterase|nr:fluoroacetyl-CoA thioesterase [Betaproteobacteria bacterium]
MKDSLQAGLTYQFKFTVSVTKTVPHLYTESALFRQMPEVLATGYLVGLLEWACIEAIKPHLDWPREQSLGTHVNFSHIAATPPGMTITVNVRLDKVEGRKLTFTLSAHDGVDKISEGTHIRHVIDVDRFNAKLSAKAKKLKAE